MTSRSTTLSTAFLCALALCGSATAADKDGQKAEPLVVRVYRVVDLVVPAPSYPYQGTVLPAMTAGFRSGSTYGTNVMGGMGGMGGGMMGGGMGGGMFQVADTPAQQSGGGAIGGGMAGPMTSSRSTKANRIDMGSLIEAITTIVEPASWDEVGGPGAISPIGGALAIRQTEAIQVEVQEFLEALKRESGTQQVLTTVATWLSLTAEQLAAIQSKTETGAPTAAGMPVDAAALAALPAEAIRYRGQITCFNGQTVYLVSGNIESAIVSAIPVVGGGHVGYQPIIAEPHIGVLLEITPAALPDEEGVLIDLHSTITHWGRPGKPQTIGTAGESGGTAIEIDRLNVSAQQFATSLRLPPGKPVLIGGINFSSDVGGGTKSTEAGNGNGLYLVVSVRASH